jgi:DNA invertase Pin-like site-specific DNA recombinase
MTVYGYARVSSRSQSHDAQCEALRRAGCEKIFAEKLSAKAGNERPQLAKLLKVAAEGDVIVVCKLDRFFRSLHDLVNTVADLGARGVGFRCLGSPIDTASADGRLHLNILGALAEYERELTRSRCEEGIERARADGVKFGRKPKLTPHQMSEAIARRAAGETTTAIAKSFNVSHSLISRLQATA